MNTTVRVLSIIAWISVMLKFAMIPGGGVLLVLSLSFLAVFYIIFGFAYFNKLEFKEMVNPDTYDTIPQARIFAGVGLGISFGITCTGILYKLQFWTGGDVHLRTGLILLTGFLVFNLYKYLKTKSKYNRGILIRVVLIAAVGFIVLSVSSLSIVKTQFRNHPQYIQAYELYEKDPIDPILIEKLDLEYHRATMTPEDFENYLKYLELEAEKKTAFSFLDYPISKGRVGNIKLGTAISSYDQQLNSLKKRETEAYQFGYDGGGVAQVYFYKDEAVFVLIPALETDSIIAIIVMNENFQTISRVRAGMKAQEVSSLYPRAKIQLNELMDWEEMYDLENDFTLVFKTTNNDRIGVYAEDEQETSPVNLAPKLEWITIR